MIESYEVVPTKPKTILMSDMKHGQTGVIHHGSYEGELVLRFNAHGVDKVITLSKRITAFDRAAAERHRVRLVNMKPQVEFIDAE